MMPLALDCDQVTPILQAIADREGITMRVEFVPYSKSRNAGEWESINWQVQLSKHGSAFLDVPYAQGIGHAKGIRPPLSSRRTIDSIIERADRRYVAKPAMGDILHALLKDSDAMNYASFDEWAESFGFDPDSTRAHSMYTECLTIALKLRAAFGSAVLEEMQLVAQFN